MKAALVKKQKDEMVVIQTQLDKLENYLQKYLLDAKLQSVNSEAGTAFLQHVASTTVRDWPAALDFIKANDEWSMLEARVNKTAVKDYIEQNGGCPPGVEYTEMIVTRVRR